MRLQLYYTVGLLLVLTSAQTAADPIKQVLNVLNEMNSNMKTMSTNIGDLNLRVGRIENRRMTCDLQAAQYFSKLNTKLDKTTVHLETKLHTVETKQVQATDEIRLNFKLLHTEVKTTANGVINTNTVVHRVDTKLDNLAAKFNQSQDQLSQSLRCCKAASTNQARLLTKLVSQSNKTQDLVNRSCVVIPVPTTPVTTAVPTTPVTTPVITASTTTPVQTTSVTTSVQTTSVTTPVQTTSVTTPVPTTSATTPKPATTVTTPVPTTSVTTPVPTTSVTTPVPAKDCTEVYSRGDTSPGVYEIHVSGVGAVRVWCKDGWTTFQRRATGDLSFDRLLAEYEAGFGRPDGDMWLGLRAVHIMTKQRSCHLRAEMTLDPLERISGMKYVEASHFAVGAAPGYRLTTTGISGTLPNGAEYLENYHNGMEFSTRDSDRDKSSGNCATMSLTSGSAGFWYNHCYYINTNAVSNQGKSSASNKVHIWWHPYVLSRVELIFKC